MKNFKLLTKSEMKNVIGGNEGLPSTDTWLCECGPNTAQSVHGVTAEDVMMNFYQGNCIYAVTCLPYVY